MASAARRAWRESRARNGALLVLMAIAFECEKGRMVEMSVAEIAERARMTDRSARNGIRELEALGELSVTPAAGGRSRYALALTPEESSAPPRKNLPPGRIFTPENISAPKPDTSQVSTPTPENISAPEISDALKGSLVSSTGGKPKASEIPRDDVERLCEHLADRMVGHGSKRPKIDKRWRTAARLLIDKDGMTEEQVHAAIDWCQDHHFWHRNIRSMEKLRTQYERLRLDARAERAKANARRNGHQPTPEEFDALLNNWARPLDEQEAGNDPSGNGGPGPVHRGSLPPAEN